ncbi:hypothetical protein SC09_contig4orf00306 [Bacillus subtilis]|uniref:Uncharacterized protein n=1 Tax=Bacillus subtilis TaxID=1423 RepID=A0A0D1KQS3_BACIU|nr:hypothetical protein SC09_contig4orf00306 [Bacillus subtilis]
MGALFLHLKPDEYLKKLYKTKKLVEKTSFSLQADLSILLIVVYIQLKTPSRLGKRLSVYNLLP